MDILLPLSPSTNQGVVLRIQKTRPSQPATVERILRKSTPHKAKGKKTQLGRIVIDFGLDSNSEFYFDLDISRKNQESPLDFEFAYSSLESYVKCAEKNSNAMDLAKKDDFLNFSRRCSTGRAKRVCSPNQGLMESTRILRQANGSQKVKGVLSPQINFMGFFPHAVCKKKQKNEFFLNQKKENKNHQKKSKSKDFVFFYFFRVK